MMGGCGSNDTWCPDCPQRKGKEAQEPPVETLVDNPFKPTKPRSSREVYHIIGPHPNGLKY